ncbi:MAG: hypothetical protein P8J87_09300 [Verrucomicrobiales bacterium]|nr:hypothetical protein [Verrucomicrobiales bacterium]
MCGKRQAWLVAIATGVGLCALPYFVTDPWWMIVVGLVLLAVPWVLAIS